MTPAGQSKADATVEGRNPRPPLGDLFPAPLWLIDVSPLRTWWQELIASGRDPVAYTTEHADARRAALRQLRVVDANAAARAHLASSPPTSLAGLPDVLGDDVHATEAISMLSAFAAGTPLSIAACDQSGAHRLLVTEAPGHSDLMLLVLDVAIPDPATTHAERMRAYVEVARDIVGSLELETVLQNIVTATRSLLDATGAIILLFDVETETLTAAVGDGYSDAELASHSFEEVMAGISGWAVRHRRPTLVDDITRDPRNTGLALQRAQANPGMGAAIVPLVVDGVALGTLTALNDAARPRFTADDLHFVEALAGQAAIAIHHARLYEEISGKNRELEAAMKQLGTTQAKLLQAQKLEAVGQLAAGIAHEINTPIQYVGDNVRFFADAFADLLPAFAAADTLATAAEAHPETEPAAAAYRRAAKDADLDFLLEELPWAVQQTLEGVERVAGIVRAMKDFAHPGNADKAPVDLNATIATTVEVARGEWKHHADLDLDLDPELPLVPAVSGPLKQAILILVVNAAQAIAESLQHGERGSIVIATRRDGDEVLVEVTDNGPGIPPDIQDRIFDPFFTTKQVGEGSGQGLPIARAAIVEQHGGSLTFTTQPGEGTTFTIRLPLASEDPS